MQIKLHWAQKKLQALPIEYMIVIDEHTTPCGAPPFPCEGTGRTATIGFFDGVHRGHAFLLQQVREEARRRGQQSLAVTFAAHPRSVLSAAEAPSLLTSPSEKLRLLAAQGMDACAVLDFSPELAALTARRFMEEYLRDRFGVRCLVIGYDHRFGSDRAACFADYVAWGRAAGIDVVQAAELPADGLHVSSSAIRRYLAAGDVEHARLCLGRSYSLGGTVVGGRHVGHTLGFPTANLRPDDARLLLPRCGVYAAWAEAGGGRHAAMVNIGRRPTLDNGDDITVEAHLIGFCGDLYGQVLTLRFEHRMRDERAFAGTDDLRWQLERDARQTLEMLR